MKDVNKLILDSYGAFENHLRNCTQWNTCEAGDFDLVGIIKLFTALLDNLERNVKSEELKEIKEIFSSSNVEFLRKLLNDD